VEPIAANATAYGKSYALFRKLYAHLKDDFAEIAKMQ
jgi:hypothetical protein